MSIFNELFLLLNQNVTSDHFGLRLYSNKIRDCYIRFDFTQLWEGGWLTFTNSLPWAAGNGSFCPFLPIFLKLIPQTCHAAIWQIFFLMHIETRYHLTVFWSFHNHIMALAAIYIALSKIKEFMTNTTTAWKLICTLRVHNQIWHTKGQ